MVGEMESDQRHAQLRDAQLADPGRVNSFKGYSDVTATDCSGREMSCGRCGKSGPLADSHVIPAAFCRAIQRDCAILFQIGTDEDAFRRKLRKGPYVTDILCPECDNWLNLKYEQHAIRALVQGRGITFVHFINEDEQAWRFDDVDLGRLKLFLLSILWRAHMTSMVPFANFDLGSLAGRVRQMVLDEDPGAHDEFPIIPARYGVLPGILMPFKTEVEGVPFWEVNLGDWQFLIKASRQATPPPFDECELRADGPRLAIPLDFHGSSHHDLLREMVLKSQKRSSRLRTGVAP